MQFVFCSWAKLVRHEIGYRPIRFSPSPRIRVVPKIRRDWMDLANEFIRSGLTNPCSQILVIIEKIILRKLLYTGWKKIIVRIFQIIGTTLVRPSCPAPPLPNPCFEKFHTPPQGPGATVLGEDPRCKLAEKSKMYGWGPGGRKGSMDWYFCGPGPFFKAVHLLFMFFLFSQASLQKQMKAYKTASRLFWKSKTAEIETSEIVKIEDWRFENLQNL